MARCFHARRSAGASPRPLAGAQADLDHGHPRRRGGRRARRPDHGDAPPAGARLRGDRLRPAAPARPAVGGLRLRQAPRTGRARPLARAGGHYRCRRGQGDSGRRPLVVRRLARYMRGPDHHFRSVGMDATALRAMQAPLKDRYKSDPKTAYITLKAKGSLDDTNIACKVETGRALAVAGLHPATGGSGMELCSGDMLLEALVACAGVTLKAVSTALDIPLKSANVSAEGDLDFRGTLGVAKDAPLGFAQIPLRFALATYAPQDKLDQLLKLTERYCVVYQTIANGPPVAIRMQRV